MRKALIVSIFVASVGILTGCHDGPLYALKSINPLYRSEWAKDQKLGPTDYQRRKELEQLVVSMPQLSDADQKYWLEHTKAILENDANADMRTLAIRSLSGYRGDELYGVCEKHFSDESPKVRMAICDVLGERDLARSVQLLATAIGSESNEDVRMAAIQSVGKQSSAEAAQSLKGSLKSRNPAIRLASVESLQGCTGKSLGEDPELWVAYLNGESVQEKEKGIADQVKGLF